jgi:hypothetical protein
MPTIEELTLAALNRIAAAEEARNAHLIAEFEERRAAWADSQADTAKVVAAITVPDPIAWLQEDNRLLWAIARAFGHSGGSTPSDEIIGRGIIAALRSQ